MAHGFDDNKGKVDLDAIFNELETNYQSNINTIYSKLVSLGSTPADKTPTGIANAIQAINDAIYNKLVSLGQTPAGKTIANLNAKIQALTEITWTYTATKTDDDNDKISGYYDCTNVKEIRVTAVTTSFLGFGMVAQFMNASGAWIGEPQRLDSPGVYTIPSGTKKVFLTTMYASTATVRFTYQTKVLR